MRQRETAAPEPPDRESLLAALHSPTVAEIVRGVRAICQPAGEAWEKPLRRFLARLLFGPLAVNEPFTRERINAVLGELQRLAARVNPAPVPRGGLIRDDTTKVRASDET